MSDAKQELFAELVSRAQTGEKILDSEKDRIISLAKELGGKYEILKSETGEDVTCVWVCQNNFACNPNSPPPNCRCRRVCW